MWKVLIVLLALAVGAAVVWVKAGGAPGPEIAISGPAVVGQTGEIEVSVTAPDGALMALSVSLEQDGVATPVYTLTPESAGELVTVSTDTVRVVKPTGKRVVPSLAQGAARVTVTAMRPVLFGLREASATATRDIEVRLAPPQVAVLSQFHYINHGGSELVVYRVSPADAESGVRVGDYEYPGFPASGAGIPSADAGLRVAFFALLWDQDRNTPITIYARDAIGNEGRDTFDFRTFPNTFKASRIEIDDRFLARVVPAILANSLELKVPDPTNLVAAYLEINRNLRRMNNETITALAAGSAPEILWRGAFKQLINTAVEAGFADQRTYFYQNNEIDRQVHLGFDLASTTAAPVLAANRGRVVFAGWLGIYGNCVILDHGMGLQSLYAHLSSVAVTVGDTVEMEAELGRSGQTGLAGGDHLHFTMLLNGNAVTPVDWWSTQWVQDRVTRKLVEAGAPAQ